MSVVSITVGSSNSTPALAVIPGSVAAPPISNGSGSNEFDAARRGEARHRSRTADLDWRQACQVQ